MQRLRKGAGIIEKKGFVLVVSRDGITYGLPGGMAKKSESNLEAGIREVREETGLEVISEEFFGQYLGKVRTARGKKYRKDIGVYIFETSGRAAPSGEILSINYWRPGCGLKLGDVARKILGDYFKNYMD